MSWGNINFVKSNTSNYRKYIMMKYQKQVITTASDRESALMLLLTALRKSWYTKFGPFCHVVDFTNWKKNPDQKFYWSTNHEFYSRLGIVIVNQPWKISGNSGMVHFTEINQDSPSYSIMQLVGRVATPKVAPINFLGYLQTTLHNIESY